MIVRVDESRQKQKAAEINVWIVLYDPAVKGGRALDLCYSIAGNLNQRMSGILRINAASRTAN